MPEKKTRKAKTFEPQSAFTSYAEMLRYVVEHGEKSENGTRFVSNVSFGLDVSPLHRRRESVFDQWIALPRMRGRKLSSIGYALTEAVWYMQQTQDPSFIVPFGPIWDKMRDEEGNVNSNYGYQIVEGKNAWLKYVTEDIAGMWLPDERGVITVPLSILRRCNVNSRTDMPCNNFVKVTFTPDRGPWAKTCGYIDVEVTTRSLDLIYGLPYDLFAAEGLGARLAYAMWKRCADGYRRPALLRNVTFNVANAHVYERDIDDAVFDKDTDEEYLALQFDVTPYAGLTSKNVDLAKESGVYADEDQHERETEFWRRFDEESVRKYRDLACDVGGLKAVKASKLAGSPKEAPLTEAIGVAKLDEKTEAHFRAFLHGLLDKADPTKDADTLVDEALAADRKAAAIYKSVKQCGASSFDSIVYVVKHSGGLHAYVQDTGLNLDV